MSALPMENYSAEFYWIGMRQYTSINRISEDNNILNSTIELTKLRVKENVKKEADRVKDFVLKGNICYSHTARELLSFENGYVVCVDGKSCGVFDKLPQKYEALPVIDYENQLIIPGLIDLHIHAPQYAYRGLGMDLELMDWLAQQAFLEEAKYAELEYARKAYSIFAEQMKKSGTTRACIFATRHRTATEMLMELMEETGLISYVGKVNMDREAPEGLREESAEVSAYTTKEWLENVSGKFQRTRPILTPRFIPSCTDELLERLGDIQKEFGLPVQSHLSENQGEIQFVKELRPQNAFYGEAYHDYNLFGNDAKTVMAHCVWSTEEEIRLIKKNGVFIAHCPASNMNLSSGIAPVKKYLDKGLKIGLGSDVAGGQSESMFRAMTDAIQVSKMYWRLVEQSEKPITFSEAFYMATKGGGEFFGKVGSFEEGYEFDAIVLDDSELLHPQELTVLQRLERATYLGMDGKGLRAKYVAGSQIF